MGRPPDALLVSGCDFEVGTRQMTEVVWGSQCRRGTRPKLGASWDEGHFNRPPAVCRGHAFAAG